MSTFTSEEKAHLPAIKVIEDWNTEQLIDFLQWIGDIPAPSILGNSKEWFKRQRKGSLCLNHFPPEASSSVPVILFSSIFGKFKDFCEEDPEREDNEFTYEICYEIAKSYENEYECQSAANDMLEKYLNSSIQPISISCSRSDNYTSHFHTDGTISHALKYCEANFEYKWSDCFKSGFSPYLENYIVIIDLLTPVFPLIWQKYDEVTLLVSRTFHALKKSLKLLDQYYDQVDKQVQEVPQTDHPVYPSFPDVIIGDKSYSSQVISQVGAYLLWEVILSDKLVSHKKAYMKAVRGHQYSLDTHQFLADAGYAPKILASSIVPGNWHLHEGNILVSRLKENEFDVKLIDFEWSGKVGSASYSHFMNREEIQWPDGAEDGKI
ncbi:19193_t:CDS:2, partial [Racocetra fulgida]